MKVNELINLWIGYNKMENFRVLICALDKEEAHEIANDYCLEAHLEGNFEITEFNNVYTHFDCDYVLI